MTVTNGATPTIAFDANMTVGGDPLLAVEDFGHDAILFFDNGSPDVANEVTIGSGLSFSGGTLSASMTPFHALAYGAMGAGLVRLVEVRLRRRRERALRRLAFDPTVFGTAVQRRAW
jgi:hypothetical protein